MTNTDDENAAAAGAGHTHSRWQLLRDLLVFQVKLFVDGMRDLIMSPISLMAGFAGLLFDRHQPERWFEQVLHWGRRSEAWINLFGRRSFALSRRGKPRGASFDQLVGEVENRLLEQYEKGGVTAQAKTVIDRAIDSLQDGLAKPNDKGGQSGDKHGRSG